MAAITLLALCTLLAKAEWTHSWDNPDFGYPVHSMVLGGDLTASSSDSAWMTTCIRRFSGNSARKAIASRFRCKRRRKRCAVAPGHQTDASSSPPTGLNSPVEISGLYAIQSCTE